MSGIIVFMPLPSDRKFDRIWAVAYIIDKGERLGVKKSAFIDRYFHHGCIWTEKTIKQYKELKEGGRAAVCKALFDISLKSPVQNSGDRIVFIDKYINLSASEYSKYCLLENELKISVGEKEINAKTASVLAGKLIQLSGGSIYDKDNVPVFFHNKKYDAIKRIVEKNQGKNILIACWFMHEKTRLMEVFPEARTIEDKKSVDSWNNGNIKIGIMNPATGGDGLDMSAGGNIIIWFSLTWSYKLYTRMNQRLYHTKKDTAEKTFVYHLIAKRTLDEKVLKILRKESGKNMTILKAITE